MSSDLLKLIALILFLDATQGTSGGIINSIGGQFYESIFLFVGFYCIGTPIGLCLLLLTELKVVGFFLATLIGLVSLNSIQLTFIYRINWKQKSDEAVALSAEDNPVAEVEVKSFSNPNFENDDLQPIVDAGESKLAAETKMTVEGETEEEEENPLKGALLVQIIKRSVMAIGFILLFFVSIYLHDIRSFDDIYGANTTVLVKNQTRLFSYH
jgi:hypothetical protein